MAKLQVRLVKTAVQRVQIFIITDQLTQIIKRERLLENKTAKNTVSYTVKNALKTSVR